MIYIGIDPGKKGGLACLNDQDNTLTVVPMPLIGDKEYDLTRIKMFLQSAVSQGPASVFGIIEKQHCMPGEGLPHTFTTGFGYGMLLGMFTGLDIPYRIATAKEWQRELFKGIGARTDTKVASILVAKRQFPRNDFTATSRSKKDADGMTDAANICVYAKRVHKNELTMLEVQCVHRVLAENPEVCIKCGDVL